MNITTLKVEYTRTLNLGDYNSAKIGAEIWADLDEGEDAAAAFAALWIQAKGEVKAQAEPLFAKQSAKAQAIFAGLPVELQESIVKEGAKVIEAKAVSALGKLGQVAANLTQMVAEAQPVITMPAGGAATVVEAVTPAVIAASGPVYTPPAPEQLAQLRQNAGIKA